MEENPEQQNKNEESQKESAIDFAFSASSSIGSQKSFDHEASLLVPSLHIIPPFDRDALQVQYITRSLPRILVDSLTHLTLSEILLESENSDSIGWWEDFNDDISLPTVLEELVHATNLFGAGVAEAVGDSSSLVTSSKLDGIKVLYSPITYLVRNPQGRVQAIKMMPGRGTFSGIPGAQVLLQPDTILYLNNHSAQTLYGMPVLLSCLTDLNRLESVLNCQVKAAVAHGKPLEFVHFKPTEDKTKTLGVEMAKQIEASLRKQTVQAKLSDTTGYVFSAGDGDVRLTTSGVTSLPDITKTVESLISLICSSASISAAMIGFQFAKEISTEAAMQSVANSIRHRQRRVEDVINKQLYPLVKLIYADAPRGDPPKFKLKEVTLQSQIDITQSYAVELNNQDRLYRMGVTDEKTLARNLGYKSIADPDRLENYIGGGEEEGNDDPNAVNNDALVKQVTNTKDNKKQSSSNNPTGGKNG